MSEIKGDKEMTGAFNRREILGLSSGLLALAGITGASAQKTEAADAKPTPRPSLDLAKKAVKDIEATIVGISREVWAMPAVGLEEHEAMEVHIRALEKSGFKITREAGGHPTSFVAEWSHGSGGPKVGFLPEYDALPGLGNVAEPVQKTPSNGDTDGHGCGHNNLGAACTGAGIALKAIMQAKNLPGTIRVYGCGAEENEGAKVYMAAKGLFNDLDCAIAWHPTPVAITGMATTSANRKITVTFRGRTAHAGMEPWQGRSALDAAELFTHGVNLMREHVRPTARNHYIYEVAGVAPNIVPDEARIWMTSRDNSSEHVDATVEWLREMAQGAAMATQTKAEFAVPHGMKEMFSYESLNRRVHEHMQHVTLNWTEAEQTFAKTCQKALGLPENGMATSVLPFMQDLSSGGSTDVADVAWNCPVAIFGWPTHPLGVSAHTWVVTACGGMTIGDKGALAAAEIMTAMGMDILTEPELRAQAKEEMAKRLAGRKYVPTLNPNLKQLGQNAKRFTKGPGEEVMSGF